MLGGQQRPNPPVSPAFTGQQFHYPSASGCSSSDDYHTESDYHSDGNYRGFDYNKL